MSVTVLECVQLETSAAGRVRHLKRLWLETEVLSDRPAIFRNRVMDHWAARQSISRLDAAPLV